VSRQSEILRVAGELFHERGFHGVGVDEIGKGAGVSGPAVYQYFKGKNEILAVLFDQAMDLVEVPDDVEFAVPREELEFLVRTHARFVAEHRSMVSIFAHEYRFLVAPWRGRFGRRMRSHAERWEHAISRCYPDASPEAVAVATQASIGLLHSVVLWPAAIRETDVLADWLAVLALEAVDALGLPDVWTAPATT
jgi:AcrR family transcriptional regulator